MEGKILVGTASWSDPGFVEDWYPRSLPATERLRYYAEHFNFVEVNSSFYAIPQRRSVEKWAHQTPADFVFNVKLHKVLSRHSATLDSLPPDLRPQARVAGTKVILTPRLQNEVLKRVLQEIEPLQAAGKLGALLLQLSPSFSPRAHKLSEIEGIIEGVGKIPLAVELRNSNWVEGEQLDQTIDFFRSHKISYVAVDAPKTKHFMVMPDMDLVTNPNLSYMRLHGRNTKGFLTGKTVAARFDYVYSEEEMQEVATRAISMSSQARRTHIVYNNNASDYALTASRRTIEIIHEMEPELIELPHTATPETRKSRLGRQLHLNGV